MNQFKKRKELPKFINISRKRLCQRCETSYTRLDTIIDWKRNSSPLSGKLNKKPHQKEQNADTEHIQTDTVEVKSSLKNSIDQHRRHKTVTNEEEKLNQINHSSRIRISERVDIQTHLEHLLQPVPNKNEQSNCKVYQTGKKIKMGRRPKTNIFVPNQTDDQMKQRKNTQETNYEKTKPNDSGRSIEHRKGSHLILKGNYAQNYQVQSTSFLTSASKDKKTGFYKKKNEIIALNIDQQQEANRANIPNQYSMSSPREQDVHIENTQISNSVKPINLDQQNWSYKIKQGPHLKIKKRRFGISDIDQSIKDGIQSHISAYIETESNELIAGVPGVEKNRHVRQRHQMSQSLLRQHCRIMKSFELIQPIREQNEYQHFSSFAPKQWMKLKNSQSEQLIQVEQLLSEPKEKIERFIAKDEPQVEIATEPNQFRQSLEMFWEFQNMEAENRNANAEESTYRRIRKRCEGCSKFQEKENQEKASRLEMRVQEIIQMREQDIRRVQGAQETIRERLGMIRLQRGKLCQKGFHQQEQNPFQF